jgi:hypothetical protein
MPIGRRGRVGTVYEVGRMIGVRRLRCQGRGRARSAREGDCDNANSLYLRLDMSIKEALTRQ